MRIGVVSDTHNNMPNVQKIVQLFNQLEVDRVIHTGDITQAKTLEVFAHLKMPLHGVYGNNDLERETLESAVCRYGFEFVDPPLHLTLDERQLTIVHDPKDLQIMECSDWDLALHGHTHIKTIVYEQQRLTFNPGECAGLIEGYNAIGVVDLSDLGTEIINF